MPILDRREIRVIVRYNLRATLDCVGCSNRVRHQKLKIVNYFTWISQIRNSCQSRKTSKRPKHYPWTIRRELEIRYWIQVQSYFLYEASKIWAEAKRQAYVIPLCESLLGGGKICIFRFLAYRKAVHISKFL
jgi:hypothetical protein